MQIDRLLEIVILLLNNGQLTARTLSNHFGVSVRTIYRDIDTLSLAGVPVSMTKGQGGGISLMKNYVLDRFFLTQKEQDEIRFALDTLRASNFPGIESTINKVCGIFKQPSQSDWIQVDFSYWGSARDEQNKFGLLKHAILSKVVIHCHYYSSAGTCGKRTIEPYKLCFKGNAWYLMGYCETKQQMRTFRISRMTDVLLTAKTFHRDLPEDLWVEHSAAPSPALTKLHLRFDAEVAHRVHDDFNHGDFTYHKDGSLEVQVEYPMDAWVISYLLSFGQYVDVLSPLSLRQQLIDAAQGMLDRYRTQF